MSVAVAARQGGASRPRREQGFALLGAILIAAIVVALAAGIGDRISFAIASTSRVLEASRAESTFTALEQAARDVLRRDAVLGGHDSLDERWAQTELDVVAADASGSARLDDLQGLFNLNNLVADPAFGSSGALPAGTPATEDGTAAPQAAENSAAGPAAASVSGSNLAAATTRVPGSNGQASATTAAAAALQSSARTDVLVPRDTVQLPVGIYHDTRPRGDGSLPGQPAPNVPPTGSSPAAASAAAAPAAPAARDRAAAAGASSIGDVLAAALGPLDRTNTAAAPPGSGTTPAAAPAGAARSTRPLEPSQVAAARFALLLDALGVDRALLPAILDWLDPDTDTRFPNGAEDDYYLALDDPYRAANRPFADVSELRLVRGVTAEIYETLKPHVCVLPRRSDINVNTAPPEVLMSLGPGIDRATADILTTNRQAQPYLALDAFTADPMLVGRPILQGGLSVASYWFSLEMRVRAGESDYAARSVIARSSPTDSIVVNRTRGFFDE